MPAHPPAAPPPTPVAGGQQTHDQIKLTSCKFCKKKFTRDRISLHQECCYSNPAIIEFMKKRGIADPARKKSEESDEKYSKIFVKSEKLQKAKSRNAGESRASVVGDKKAGGDIDSKKSKIGKDKSKIPGTKGGSISTLADPKKSKVAKNKNASISSIGSKKSKLPKDAKPASAPAGHHKAPPPKSPRPKTTTGARKTASKESAKSQKGDWRQSDAQTKALIQYDKDVRDGKINPDHLREYVKATPTSVGVTDAKGDIVICLYCGRRIIRPRAYWHIMRCQDLAYIKQREAEIKQAAKDQKAAGTAAGGKRLSSSKRHGQPPNLKRTSFVSAYGEGKVDVKVVEVGPTYIITDYGEVYLPVHVRNPKVGEMTAYSTENYKKDLIQCPYCGRSFFPIVAQRHIPQCKYYEHNKNKK